MSNNVLKKSDKVKAYFDKPERYLKYNYNIKIRSEIIKGFLQNKNFISILDVACGNGDISIQFLNKKNKLTLLDISNNMLTIALNNVPDIYKKNVKIINSNILDAKLPERVYDLIICTGLLAHIEAPIAAIEKIISLSMPGGIVVLQNTNSEHFYSYLNSAYRLIGTFINRDKYNYIRIKEKIILDIFNKNNFKLVKKFCYIQSFMVLDRIMKAETKYVLIKKIFGDYDNNSRASLGNDCIYYFEKSCSEKNI